jgi:hypothetical protein
MNDLMRFFNPSTANRMVESPWNQRAQKAARAVLRTVPAASAAQVTVIRVAREGAVTYHTSGSQPPRQGSVLWVLFVQSHPQSSTGWFDSFSVYVEESNRVQAAPDEHIIRACFASAKILYPRYAKGGVIVHLHYKQIGSRRFRGKGMSWEVKDGSIRPDRRQM